jgi:hypothetical protein
MTAEQRDGNGRGMVAAVLTGLAIVIVAFGITLWCLQLGSANEGAPDRAPRVITLTPCEHEDSRNCYWDADERGNGEGVSFVDIDGVAYYPEEGR